MEREKFYQIIDQLAEDWLIDANSPVKGVFKNQSNKRATGPRRRINSFGAVMPANETNGCVQVIKFKHQNLACPICGSATRSGFTALINLRSKTIRADDCGCRLPYHLTKKSQNV